MPRKADMPRKAAGEAATPTSGEPRRSTRISSLPQPPAEVEPKAPVKRKRAKEGTATGEGVDPAVTESKMEAEAATEAEAGEGSNKKAKGDSTDDNEEKDELASDISEDVKTLSVGDSLPAMTLKNEKDEDVNVQELASENGVVLFLVPKADTPGCSNQACGFRDIYPDFEAVNYKVYCLSADTSAAQSKWQSKFTLPYALLSDRQRVLIKALGAADGKKTKRSHFIFEKGGKLLDRKIPVKPADSPKLAMQFIKSLSPAA